ncbi:ino80 chromatin remodeling complex protein [Colletotrichum asianum]|uniref:Ino80 chromatin remodeling complex protein n=1 Tax=Colletotrichum asianum TaxID=702518 RepID=A0A8H3WRN1_9PEZI|nr:ino80 chromatin remodeling complex protein [Colletotrichum asianum]
MAGSDSRQLAKELVQEIATKYGYLEEETLRHVTNPEARRKIENAIRSLSAQSGLSIITLAKNLYSSKTRFIFELLQNADDNQYNKASASGSVPFVSFHIFPDQIIIECNEDGFTHENMKAICAVGESSKTGAQGYIGEKGIGFKSVFMVAWKVHIQSNAFSFSFIHKKGESGMGMITPVWEETDEVSESPLTVITLHLLNTETSNGVAETGEMIRAQFDELQETVLLFLKNIRRISVSFYDDDERQTTTVSHARTQPQPGRVELESVYATNGRRRKQTKHFHVTRVKATNLAKNDNRTYTEAEEAVRAYSASEVVVAFPLSKKSVPIVEPQDVFAFLPVRPAGFNFVIQADFVTNANRQDILKDSRRNIGLLHAVGEAFVTAAIDFQTHETLRYQWVQFLPDRNSSWDGFWLGLVKKIAVLLRSKPVLYDHKSLAPRTVDELLRLLPDCADEHGNPLFDDGNPAQVISRRYSQAELRLLGGYGLRDIDHSRVIDWLRADLRNAKSSRMKSPDTPESWHERAAKFLNAAFVKKMHRITAELVNLDLIPLADGTWASTSSGPIYFAQAEGFNVPADVGLRVVTSRVTDHQRLLLFKSLGVTSAEIQLVRRKILQSYKRDTRPEFTIGASKDHLKFLYMTEYLVSRNWPYESIPIFSHRGECQRPNQQTMYLANDDPHGAEEVFKPTSPGPNPGDGALGYNVVFVNREYFEDEPRAPQGQKRSWRAWFSDRLGVRTHIDIQIISDLFSSVIHLSDESRYIQLSRPNKFMACVVQWYNRSPSLQLKEGEIRCLQSSTRLQERVARFIGEDAFFPWLWLERQEVNEAIPPKWKNLLSKLSVGQPVNDLEFALVILNRFIDAYADSMNPARISRLFELYQHIHIQYRESDNRVAAAEIIRNAFQTRRCIFVPRDELHKWALPDECVWTAPLDMRTKFALERLYQPWFRTNGTNSNSTYLNLFRSMIGIEDCTWAILIDELKELKASKCDDTDQIGTIYKALNALCRDPSVVQNDHSKSIFEDEALIYLPVDSGLSWHRPSECVWSNATKLSGRVSLNEEFEDLEIFFVDFLGVKPLDLSMAIDDLKSVATRASVTSSEIKDLIWAVNSLLPTVQKPPSSREVLKTKIFPIAYPNGRVTVGTATTGFCVIDRESLRSSFKNKVNFLDFTLEQVARLRPFLEWTHLENRYLSRCVKEITSFHGGAATPITNPQRQIRHRAHALLRVAAHFDSPRSQNSRDMDSLYAVLRSARIYETDGISSDLCIVQGETSFDVEGEKSSLHIDETQSGLKIYVPRNKDHQEYMFTNLLPDKLLDCMMRHPVTQVSQNVTNSAMNATKNIVVAPLAMLHRALEDNGIAEVQVANVDEVVALDTASSATAVSVADTRTDNNANGRGGSEAEDAEIRMAFASSSSTNQHAVVNATVHRSMSAQSSVWSPNIPSQSSWTPSSGGSRNDASSQAPYTALLSKVIAAGQRPRANALPLCGAFDLSQLYTDLQPTRDDAELGLRSASQIERDCKIGAAGELYVFELLSHLSDQDVPLPPLPEFSRDNWQSNIRRYVTVHPDYALMEPWSDRETSDIVYEDVSKQLTSLLVRQGYLETRWLSRPRGPKYFIEVKTTTMSCETAFYMSKAQYQRMRNNLVTDDSDTMYVIFRVYNLGQKDIGLKVYVDPETLRLAGRLKFTGETWSVVPG